MNNIFGAAVQVSGVLLVLLLGATALLVIPVLLICKIADRHADEDENQCPYCSDDEKMIESEGDGHYNVTRAFIGEQDDGTYALYVECDVTAWDNGELAGQAVSGAKCPIEFCPKCGRDLRQLDDEGDDDE